MSQIEQLPVSENGHIGQLVSLGGVRSRPGSGRIVRSWYGVATFAVPTEYIKIPANPGRISLFIQSWEDAAGILVISLGGASGSCFVARLGPGESFQIDQNLPWTGPVEFNSALANSYYYACEVSIEQQ